MMIFAKCLDALPGMEWLSLPDEVAVFGEMMNQQLDLRVEADNLHRFEANFASRGKRITFPKPIELANANSSDVLVEEFQDAVALKWFLRHGGGGYDDAIANIGLDAFLVSLDFVGGDWGVVLTKRKCSCWTTGPTVICTRKSYAARHEGTTSHSLHTVATSWSASTSPPKQTTSRLYFTATHPRSSIPSVSTMSSTLSCASRTMPTHGTPG